MDPVVKFVIGFLVVSSIPYYFILKIRNGFIKWPVFIFYLHMQLGTAAQKMEELKHYY